MEKKFNDLFLEIVSVLRRDYAGKDLLGERFHPRYYNQSIGQAWNDGRLDDLLFLRYVSQMLACSGDRHLRLALRPNDHYTPWGPGFFTRRCGDFLYVTHVTGDSHLSVGDRISAVNRGNIPTQRRLFQQNFLYAAEEQREDWNGVLKMADNFTVLSPDGTEQILPAEKHDPCPPPLTGCAELMGDILYVRPAPFDGAEDTIIDSAVALAADCKGLVLDLRNARGTEEAGIYPYLSLICSGETPLSSLLDTDISVNYTRLNCILKAAGLTDIPEAADYIEELKGMSGRGFVSQTDDLSGEAVPGIAHYPVVVLTDTWCRDAGETLALCAKRTGATLLGRPTLGTLDFCGDVSMELDDRFVLTWPTALSAQALSGQGTLDKGILPDISVPWTPEELTEDSLLSMALAQFDK